MSESWNILCQCQNCGYENTRDALPHAKDLSQRIEIGDPFTDVECPECGALCYPELPEQTKSVVLTEEEQRQIQNAISLKWEKLHHAYRRYRVDAYNIDIMHLKHARDKLIVLGVLKP